jgi:hypothetical protein
MVGRIPHHVFFFEEGAFSLPFTYEGTAKTLYTFDI